MIEIEWSKVKKADGRSFLPDNDGSFRYYHCDFVGDCDLEELKNKIFERVLYENEGFKYYSIRGVISGMGVSRYDIFFWKEKPELIGEV